MSRAFLDSAAGQPLHPSALEARRGFSDRTWADPHQSYHEARASAQVLNAARETVAKVVGIAPAGVSFHPKATCSTLAISGAHKALEARTDSYLVSGAASHPRVFASQVERAEVLESVQGLREGALELLPVDSEGRIDLTALSTIAADETANPGRSRAQPSLLVLQNANIEVGTRQPTATALHHLRLERAPHDPQQTSHGASPAPDVLVTDATGSLGLVDIDPVWSVLFADAAGWAGPPDIGVLAIRSLEQWQAPTNWNGTGTLPSGYPIDTVGVLAAAETAAALHAVYAARRTETARLTALVDRVREEVPRRIADVEVLGDPLDRLPNIVTFSVLYADGERLASELDRLGVAVGSGSACASRAGLPSHVLTAIGALTHGNVRVSLPLGVTDAAIDHFLSVLPRAVAAVRDEAGAP